MSTLLFRRSRVLSRYLAWERELTLIANRLHEKRFWHKCFAIASRLGDGIGWYLLIFVVFMRHGPSSLPAIAAMLSSAAIGVVIYLTIKRLTARPRPCAVCSELYVSVPPLDQYSFPSGHTLHAVNFALQLTALTPELAWIVIPFAVAVAVSRIVLGLHYLSDVIAGAMIGWLLALLSSYFQGLIAYPAV